MGQQQNGMSPSVLKGALRQAKIRIGLRRGQKLNEILKKKQEIAKYMESGNEFMALLHVMNSIN